MKKRKKERELSEQEEIDAYFSDATKKSFPVKIIFILLLLLCVGGCIFYYFVVDSPQGILLRTFSETGIKLGKIMNAEKVNYDFFLETNIDTNNKEYINVMDIIERISVKGNFALDYNQNKTLLELTPYYQKEELLNVKTTIEGNNAYIKLENIFDKIIKVNLSDEENTNEGEATIEISLQDTKKLSKSLEKILPDVLMQAKYTKEYTDLNNTKTKKVTLNIDKELMEYFYDKLLNDNDFMEIYSKMEGITESKLEEKIINAKSKLDNSVAKIILYVSILKNEYIMLECSYKEDRITITKENNSYNYKIYKNSIIRYQGTVSIEEINNDYQISIKHDDIEEEISMDLDLSLKIEFDKEVEFLDTNNSVNYKDLSNTDTTKITKKLLENENIKSLYKDIVSSIISGMMGDMYLETAF